MLFCLLFDIYCYYSVTYQWKNIAVITKWYMVIIGPTTIEIAILVLDHNIASSHIVNIIYIILPQTNGEEACKAILSLCQSREY